jgi:N6-L-threonylcarbamoyladenine synthase
VSPASPEGRLVLGIETSCDETAASVVCAAGRAGGCTVLSNVIASQHDLHAEYAGVVPEIASRAHAERILPIVRRALADAHVSLADVHGIAVGNRPGLIGSLLVGVAAAKALAWSLGLPVIGVDHVQAHLYAGCIGPPGHEPPTAAFPAIGLVVSGGHTSLYLCQSPVELKRIGATIDDAVGEAYDKVATVLGLPFPGGPNLDRLARTGTPAKPGFPIARINPQSLDFSFSGLKTAAIYAFKGVPADDETRARRIARGEPASAPTLAAADVAATFQQAAVASVMLKLERALDRHPECRTLLVGGGVTANSLLRERLTTLATSRRIDLRLPAMEYCLDNAAMIAGLGAVFLDRREWQGDALTMTAAPTSAAL